MTEFGLGAIQSPPDERDYPIEALFEARGLTAGAPPPSYVVPVLPPVYDQGITPMCVAYSDAAEQAAFDLLDQHHNYRWDFATFFRRIGGGPNGAYVRAALEQRLKVGYPLLPRGSDNSYAAHRIAADYAVPKTKLAICRAIQAFGVCIVSTPWFHSWFRPAGAHAVLPAADFAVGGHAIAAIGWTPAGLRLRNSWGADWGNEGDCLMPWSFVLHSVWDVWKAVDVIDTIAAQAAGRAA
jgi:hypothetical protein